MYVNNRSGRRVTVQKALMLLTLISLKMSYTRSTCIFNQLKHHFCHTSDSHHFFFNRIVKLWNHLAPVIDISFMLSAIR